MAFEEIYNECIENGLDDKLAIEYADTAINKESETVFSYDDLSKAIEEAHGLNKAIYLYSDKVAIKIPHYTDARLNDVEIIKPNEFASFDEFEDHVLFTWHHMGCQD